MCFFFYRTIFSNTTHVVFNLDITQHLHTNHMTFLDIHSCPYPRSHDEHPLHLHWAITYVAVSAVDRSHNMSSFWAITYVAVCSMMFQLHLHTYTPPHSHPSYDLLHWIFVTRSHKKSSCLSSVAGGRWVHSMFWYQWVLLHTVTKS